MHETRNPLNGAGEMRQATAHRKRTLSQGRWPAPPPVKKRILPRPCRACGKRRDTRGGICFSCATKAEKRRRKRKR